MEDVTEELNKSELVVAKLAAKAPGRWLRFELLDRSGTGFETVEFYQSQLGLMPMQEFFNRIRREIQNVMSGEYGTSIGELFTGDMAAPKIEGATAADVNKLVSENMTLINAVLDLIQRVPDFELDVYCLALGVHERDVDWVKKGLSQPPYRGGLTIQEGPDIIRTFVRDNAAAVIRFFTEDVPMIVDDVREILAEASRGSSSDSSTGGMPSSTTSPAMAETASTT